MRKLERDAGLHKNFISNLLQDRSKNPGIDSIIRIATVLDVSIDKLVGKEPSYKIHNIDVDRKEIFVDVLNYLSTTVKNRESSTFKLDDFFSAVHEIYMFSLKKSCFDKEFADWFISSQL